MNEALRYAARPNDFISQNNGVPAEAIAMARQLGLSAEDMKQMPAMWRNLDELHESDPETYKSFTQNILAEGPPSQGGKAQSFIPNASFVVKLHVTANGGSGTVVKVASGATSQKMFVNFTSHIALERPKDQFGRPVEDGEKRGADGLQIPLLVGEVRQCADHTGDSSLAVAVDVVFHEWVTQRCDEDNSFKAQVVDLALSWIRQETGYKLENGWKTIKSKYKGGLGEMGDRPMPFPISKAMEQEEPIDKRSAKEEHKEDPIAPRSEPQQNTIPPLATLSPENLLQAKKGSGAEGTSADSGMFRGVNDSEYLKMPGALGSDKGGKSKVLIEEVVSDVQASGQDEGKTKKKKKRAAVKKGFLHTAGKSGPKLYGDSGSSGDGQKEGSYSRLMSKCKVVDMSTMSKEEQKKAMEQHASGNTRGTTSQQTQPPQPPIAPKVTSSEDEKARKNPSFNGIDKGFLKGDKKNKSLYGDEGSPEGNSSSGDKESDVLFDKLMAGIDPDYAEASRPISEDKKDTVDALGDIASILSGNATGGSVLGGLESLTTKTPEIMEPLRGLDDDIPSTSRMANLAPSLSYDINVEKDADSNRRSCRITISLPKDVPPAAVELGTSSDTIRLMAPGCETLEVPIPFGVGDTRAKFSKKKGLVVTVKEGREA